MITQSQMKNVISYYLLQMSINDAAFTFPLPEVRDAIVFNKLRAELCGSLYNKPKWKDTLKVIHESVHVQQVNSVPVQSVCNVDNIPIPVNHAGVQLLCRNKEGKIEHLVLQKKYQQLCNNYFKLRHYPELLQQQIRTWLTQQVWYIPGCYTPTILCCKVTESSLFLTMFHDLQSIAEALNNACA